MRSVLLFLAVVAAFAAAVFGAMKVMDSGDAPAAIARKPRTSTRILDLRSIAPPKPRVAPKPRKSAAERSGDRWVNQAEGICREFERQVQMLVQSRTPQTTTVAIYRKAFGYERGAVTRLHGLQRPHGQDRPLVDRLLRVLDRHLVAFDAVLDAVEANDLGRAQGLASELLTLTRSTERAAAELGAFTCAWGG